MPTEQPTETSALPEGPGYVDVYLLPVPEQNLGPYQVQAAAFGDVVREHGGHAYREFLEDDVPESLGGGDGRRMTVAVAEFASRAHRDEVMTKVMADPRVAEMMAGDELAAMAEMRYGGFTTFVDA